MTGRPVRRLVVSDDYRAALVARGLSEHVADLLLGMFAASRQGEFALVDATPVGIL